MKTRAKAKKMVKKAAKVTKKIRRTKVAKKAAKPGPAAADMTMKIMEPEIDVEEVDIFVPLMPEATEEEDLEWAPVQVVEVGL